LTCGTNLNIDNKFVSCTTGFHLIIGVYIRIKFANGSTTSAFGLNVNNTGLVTVKTFYFSLDFVAGEIINFAYDGTN